MKYQIGDKVIFTAHPSYCRVAQNDSGKIATIVKYYEHGFYDIFIKDSENNRFGNDKITYHIPERDLKPAVVKYQQLLFEFMYG